MKGFLSVLLVLIICLCILNYGNDDATFSIEEYITNLSENVEFMPKPPSASDFVSYQDFVNAEEKQGIFDVPFFKWLGHIFSVLWSFIMYPFKLLFWLVKSIIIFFKDLLIWG